MSRPEKFGRFQVIDELGKGAMGIVYKAVDPVIDRAVAIKTLSEEAKADTDLHDRFTREARSAGVLNHPNIITVYDVGEEQGTPFLALEYLKGRDLEDLMASGEELPFEKRVGIIRLTARGLAHAHERGVVHRDIKPGNLFLTSDGVIKVTDFGIARSEVTEETKPGVILGSVGYMAPEQIRGWDLDGRIDIFALGAIAFELFTGQRAFPGENIMAVMNRVLNEDLPPASSVSPESPSEFDPVLAKALARDRDQRYESAAEFADDLDAAEKAWKRRTRGLSSPEIDEELWQPISADELFGEAEFDSPLEGERRAEAAPRRIWLIFLLVFVAIVALGGGGYVVFLYRQHARQEQLQATLARDIESIRGMIEQGRYSDAATEIDWVLRRDPYHRVGMDLRKEIDDLLAHQADIPPLLEAVDKAMREENFSEAKEICERILTELDPVNAEAKARLEEIKEAMLDEQQIESILLEAATLYQSAAFSMARAKWETVLSLDPDNQEALKGVRKVDELLLGTADLDEWYELAQQAKIQRDYATQVEYLERIVQRMGNDPPGEKIRKELRSARAMHALNMQIDNWHKEAERLYEEGDYYGAIRRWKSILEVDPRNRRAQEMVAKAQAEMRD